MKKENEWILFAVVIKVVSGKNSGKLVTTHMFEKSEDSCKKFILSCGLEPVVVSKEW